MSEPKVRPLSLEGLLVLEPRRFIDGRGAFMETWSRRAFASHGLDCDFVQDNCSISTQTGTLRGLHAQSPPHAQDKLIWVVRGAVFDVAVDIRIGSPTFGHWAGVDLSAENGRQMLVPKGFLHGFVTRAPETVVIYKCTAPYAPQSELSVRFDDPRLSIDWGLDAAPIISDKDAAAPAFDSVRSPFAWTGAVG